MIDSMTKHVHDTLEKEINEDHPSAREKSRSTAFGYMVAILENGQRMSHQIRDLEDVMRIWKSLDEEVKQVN